MSLKLNMSRSNISHERDPDDDCYKAPSSCPASSFPHPSSIFSFKHKYLLEALFFSCKSRMQERMEIWSSKSTQLVCVRERIVDDFFLFILLMEPEMSSCLSIPGQPLNLKRSATNANQTALIMRWCWFKETDEWKNAFFFVCSSRSSHMKPEATAFRLRTRKKRGS